ncbi:hypothetical protein [Paenibacillus gallinarum]|uniref:Uncharacterized protein n=1 Tax=Paenibacillus gallinarum TaxID=2762232 RepID=A0ABR8T4G4_9BACL|nr:hypothetical protein [Paenibacillus gallinarum]MBD7970485.1 hypothetical protein [Paenibacillus gallinarum]
MFILVIFGLLFIFAITMIVVTSRLASKKRSTLQGRGAVSFTSAAHIEGLGIEKFAPCNILQFPDRIQIESGSRKYQIPINNMRVAVLKSEKDIIEKNKSVVGRALIGTVLVPGLGTIVGGMSGIGKKNKSKINYYLILNYLNSQGELDAVTFLDNPLEFTSGNFIQSVNEKITDLTSQETVTL